jgi:hypothetical protein
MNAHIILEPEQLSMYIVVLDDRGIGDRFAAGDNVILLPHIIQAGSGSRSVSYRINMCGLFRGSKAARGVNIYLHLVSGLRLRGAISPLPHCYS